MSALNAAKASPIAQIAVPNPVVTRAQAPANKAQAGRRKSPPDDDKQSSPAPDVTEARQSGVDLQKSETSSPSLLAQAPINEKPSHQSASATTSQPTVEASAAKTVEAESITAFLLKPMTAHTASPAASWLGATPTGAVLSGAIMGVLTLQSNGQSGTPAPASDTSAPQLTGADISNAAGNQLVLRYNENLNAVLPAASAFEVMVNGISTPVASVARGTDQKSVVLTLSNAISGSSEVTVSLRDGSAISDLAGNAAATFLHQAVTVTDLMPPALLSSQAITNSLQSVIVLRFSEVLKSSALPDAASFSLSVGGVPQIITAREVFGDSLRLTLASKITSSNPNISLQYTPPSNAGMALQDAAGNLAAVIGPVGGIAVTHTVDTTAPVLNSDAASVAAKTREVQVIHLSFSESLNASALPSPSSFVVSAAQGGITRSVAVSSLQLLGSVLALTLATPVTDSLAGLRVNYVVPSAGPVLQDWAGNSVAAFDRSVSRVDAVAPSMVSSRFINDRTLELTFDEPLAAQGPNVGAWRLTANGGTVLTPTSSTVAGRTITLGFASAVQSGQALSLAYTAASADPSTLNPALQDVLGNDSSSFSRTLDTTAPSLVSAVTSPNGLQIWLIYNESLLSPNSTSNPVIPAVGASAFAVLNALGERISVSNVNVSGSQVQLTLASAVKPSDTIRVFYTPPSANIGVNNAAIQDAHGNDAGPLGSGVVGQAVTNNTALGVAQVQLGSQTHALDEVVLQFNEAIGSGSLPSLSAFTVKSGAVTQTIARVSRDSSDSTKLILTLSGTIDDPGALLVSYTQPSSNPLTGASGKALPAFTDQNFGQVITTTSATETASGAAGRVDYFLGSTGNDTLSGLGGADQFVWPDFGSSGPGGFMQTLTDFGFKKGVGSLQGSAEADLLDLSQLLNGYTQANESMFLRAIKNSNNFLQLQIDHDGGSTFAPTASLLFSNVSVDASDRLLVNNQFIAHTVGATTVNLTLGTLLEHLRIEGQLTVL